MPATTLLHRSVIALAVSAALLAGQWSATAGARADPLPMSPTYGLAGTPVTVTPSAPAETKCVLYVDGTEVDSFGCGPDEPGDTFTIDGAPGKRTVLVCVSTCDPADAGSAQQQATFSVQTRVPDVRGHTVQEATATLRDAGLALGTVHTRGNRSANALIVHQHPAHGSAAFVNSPVAVRLHRPAVAAVQQPLPTQAGQHTTPATALQSAAVGALAAATPASTRASPGLPGATRIGILVLAVLLIGAAALAATLTRRRRPPTRVHPGPHVTARARGAAQHVTMRPGEPGAEPDVTYTVHRTSSVTTSR